MGILNLTPDSFSDGGDFFSIESALNQVENFIINGVDVIDIGAQSTRPGAEEIGANAELERLLPILKEIRLRYPSILISIDTFNSKVAQEAIKYGVNWINDVTGGRRDSKILDLAAEVNCPFIITHSRGNSKNMNKLNHYDDLIDDLIRELNHLSSKALERNIPKENIILDPGLGFSKNTIQNVSILKNLDEVKKLGYPVLIGASRKRFIGDILNEPNPKDRDIGSLAVSCFCSQAKVDIVRVHNVQLNSQILKVADSINR